MTLRLLVLLGWLLGTTACHAANVAPLGFELGTTTRSDLQARLKDKVELTDAGTNRYSNGPMLDGVGEGLGIEGLQHATFIFDARERLVAVMLQLPKGFANRNTTNLANMLSEKYRQVHRNIPAVGNASARFTYGNSIIELEAPHMAFDFTVFYMTESFERALREQRAHERNDKERSTRGNL